MDELDILKKHWKENQKFPKITQDEIREMIHKKSSSLVMWIFIISIIEFLVLNVVSYLIPLDNQTENIPLDNFIKSFDYISLGISLVFIFLFYNNYRKIKTYSSSRDLMNQIIKTKKTVNYYIYTNIFIVISALGYIIFSEVYESRDNALFFILITLFIILTLIITLGIWLFYKLVYGILLKRLSKNLKELQKIDEE